MSGPLRGQRPSGKAVPRPSQLRKPSGRRCFELGNTEIHIRPYITLAEPTDLQKNFGKGKKIKSKQIRGTLATAPLPMGKNGIEF